MTEGLAELEHVLGSLSLRLPDAPVKDLGSPRRTHVFVVGDLVVKCDARGRVGSGSMVRERAALELLAPADLPVPRLLNWGDLGDGRSWVVLTRLPGASPADAHRPAHELSPGLARQLGSIVARLHGAVEPPAFGTWAQPPRRTFVAEHRHRVSILASMARDARSVPGHELEAVLHLLRATEDAATEITAPVLAHRDVQPRNVLVDGSGRVTALLDFESSAGGHPAEDFRVIGLDWESPAFASFAAAYAESRGPLGPGFADGVAHFVLEWVLAVFAYLGGIVPAYLPPAMVAVERVRAGERPALPQNERRRKPSA